MRRYKERADPVIGTVHLEYHATWLNSRKLQFICTNRSRTALRRRRIRNERSASRAEIKLVVGDDAECRGNSGLGMSRSTRARLEPIYVILFVCSIRNS
ncbi:hypothetical protein EVAR_39424_1 [Eumeta japonica]|uniref:Uncharacterized protein n=1 Tax=Eumeta variegata TaxID=151549 RepID=A0A4C1Z0H3_EUMVA|nr:hypothetical protein EVAR_39424_1 [Eumeta japonica]